MDGLFPLPLAPFEDYLLADDCRDYPMTFVIELQIKGELRREPFEQSVLTALARHPLLQSIVIRPRGTHPEWARQPKARPVMDWGGYNDPVECADPFIDLSHEIGLRLWIRVGNGFSRLTFQFHHSCCDAFGALTFLTDVAVSYGDFFPREMGDWAPNDTQPEKLRKRDELWVRHYQKMNRMRFLWRVLNYAARVVFRTVAPVAAPRSAAIGLRQTFPGLTRLRCEPDLLPRLRRFARKRSCTVNDVLITELLQTLRDWNRRYAPRERCKWLSILMPANLRNLDHDGMPAANVASYAFIQRTTAACDDPDGLLDGIRRENEFVRNWRYAAVFANAVGIVRQVPGLLRYMIRRRRTAATAVLSYVSDPSRMMTSRLAADPDGSPVFGNVKLIDVAAAPPIRPLTRTAFSVWHLNDVLSIGLNADPSLFSHDDSVRLLDQFAGRLSQTAAKVDVRQRRRAAA